MIYYYIRGLLATLIVVPVTLILGAGAVITFILSSIWYILTWVYAALVYARMTGAQRTAIKKQVDESRYQP